MSKTPIADMVEKMHSGGIPVEFIVLAVRTAELVAQQRVDSTAEKRRSWDRARKLAAKNSTGMTENRSSLSSSSSFFLFKEKKEEEEKKEKNKKFPLPDDWAPSPSHFTDGAALGFSHDEILDQAQDMRLWAGATGARRSSWILMFSGWMRRTRKTLVGKQRAKPADKAAKSGASEKDIHLPPWERQGITKEQYVADLEKERMNGNGHK